MISTALARRWSRLVVSPMATQHPGEVGDGGIDAGDGGEVGADVEAAHAVFGGPGGLGEDLPGGGLFAGGGGVGVGGDDGGLDEGLEPGPGDPAVRGGRDPGVDVGGFLGGEVAGLAGHVAGVALGDLECLDPGPELREPVLAGRGRRRPAGRRRRRRAPSGRPAPRARTRPPAGCPHHRAGPRVRGRAAVAWIGSTVPSPCWRANSATSRSSCTPVSSWRLAQHVDLVEELTLARGLRCRWCWSWVNSSSEV